MHDPLLPRVQSAFQRAFHLDPRLITLDTQPDDIAKWDSLGHASLALNLELEFNIRFDMDELMALRNVREIIRIVRCKLDATA